MHEDGSIIRASIKKESRETVLHIVASKGHCDFMKKLLELLREDDLYLLDKKGNTAFCLAVAAGKVRVAKIMLEKDPLMATLKCAEGWSPLRLATFRGHSKMAWFLYPKIIEDLEQEERVATFFICINRTDTSLYELALKMLLEYRELAEARDTSGETAFHLLAGKPKAFRSAMLKCFLHICLGKQLESPGLQVLKQLWKIVSEKDEKTVKGIFLTIPSKGKPSNALFIAAKCGNAQFLAELIASDPALIIETDERDRNVFHIGAMYHQWSIFSLVDKLGADEHSILSAQDDRDNTILHLAAKVAGPLQWDEMVGPAIRMKRDLKWFKDVTKVVPPDCLDKTNLEDKRPGDIFIEQHRALNDLLVNQKEMSWTTLLAIFASSFGIVAALVGAANFVLQQIRSN
ncbi:uncharacterized protein LOC133716031 [Rosa rugosa]|uniref:uncharacterized protein LOC133716031 n=1 Tax=Rosa rugosa TaxID=74645 RepID=UPI002B406AB2|nr:uncharacterized protein LOC133716031 [Rosa rugosa]XP_061998749.1 uncharacterized protein LOC133716031 [Rosa rugosa]XP_061998750.1 uncharacterized protein LOC133716031 [Rosa rugosa]